MGAEKAFTLVELLVVIAIIALLMSILMPALAKARKQAKIILCQSNLKQMASACVMYTNDYDGRIWRGWAGPADAWQNSVWWCETKTLQVYYRDPDVRLCPEASKPLYPNGGRGATFYAWAGSETLRTDGCGSFGVNGWLEDQPEEFDWLNPARRWRTANLAGAAFIPMFVDCRWIDGWPQHYDAPPDYSDMPAPPVEARYMVRFCINRHEGYVNGAFLDCSVRKIGLKELWKLKWNRMFDVDGGPTPEEFDAAGDGWMRKFKDYY
jgi:prepilin-type N-terminal cleavage/methylation domain-containing protein/prepilin-type processing-associated H-X9-DG protein